MKYLLLLVTLLSSTFADSPENTGTIYNAPPSHTLTFGALAENIVATTDGERYPITHNTLNTGDAYYTFTLTNTGTEALYVSECNILTYGTFQTMVSLPSTAIVAGDISIIRLMFPAALTKATAHIAIKIQGDDQVYETSLYAWRGTTIPITLIADTGDNGRVNVDGYLTTRTKPTLIYYAWPGDSLTATCYSRASLPDPQRFQSVQIDGEIVPDKAGLANHTEYFSNVQEPHTVRATFRDVITYNLHANSSSGGEVLLYDGLTTTLDERTDVLLEFQPEPGNKVRYVSINGVQLPLPVDSYLIEDIREDHTVYVEFVDEDWQPAARSSSSSGCAMGQGSVTLLPVILLLLSLAWRRNVSGME